MSKTTKQCYKCKLIKDVSKFGKTADKASTRATGGFGKMKKGLGSFASTAMLAGGLTLGAGFIVQDAFTQIRDYDQAQANLAGVMGKTRKENEALEIDAKRLGATTAKSAIEVVGLQESYARLGFGMQKIT